MIQTATDSMGAAQLSTDIQIDLRKYDQFVLWRGADRLDQQTGEVTGLNKVPYTVHLSKASTTNPQTWASFDQCVTALPMALEAWEEEDPSAYRGGGLGFVFTATDPYAGVDLDHCRDPETGEINPWAQQLVHALASYTEVSPSGTGVHLFVQGHLSEKGRKRGDIELYDRERYFTVTGDHLPGTPTTVAERQAVVEWLYVAMPIMTKLLADSGRREKFGRLFAGDISGYGNDDSRADLALCSLAAHAGASNDQIDALMRLSGLYREKWEREDYRGETIGKALEAQGATAKAAPQTQTGGRIQVQSARDLASKELSPVRWVVHNLIPEGLTLFAGGAKIGKSWAVLGMGIAVATGDRVFQYFDTEPGDVLYFALEDGQRRMQSRLDALSEGWEAPDSLRFVYECPELPEFKETVEALMGTYPNTRLVIVDVLAKVQRRVKGIHNPYHADYDALAPLQRLALNQGIGVVLVTHTNQREMPTDELHTVTGTTGNIGCADTILLLKRGRSEASGVLYVTGRDVVEGVFKAAFHNGVWRVEGEQTSPQPGPEPAARADAQAFLRVLLADGPRLATEVQEAATAAGISIPTLRRAQKDLGIKSIKEGKEWSWSFPAGDVHKGGER